MKAVWAHIVLVAGVSVAACGGAATQTPPATGSTRSESTTSPPADGTSLRSTTPPSADVPSASPERGRNDEPPSGTPLPAASGAGPSTAIAPAGVTPAPKEMNAPAPSVMLSDLQALGLDPESLSPIEKIEPRALRRVMKVLAKSLGAKCTDCHVEGDFAAVTRRKRIAAKMWDEFVVNFAMADGSALFCDSCHKGRLLQLDRSDKKLLESEMDANFVHGLKRRDGAEITCETCHVVKGMPFLEKWGAGK